jgi:hypothetical protein
LELGTTRVGRDAKQREALFREFAEYAKTQRITVAYRDTSADH